MQNIIRKIRAIMLIVTNKYITKTHHVTNNIKKKKGEEFCKLIIFLPSADGKTIFSCVSAFFKLSVLNPSNSLFKSTATRGKSFNDGTSGGTGQDILKNKNKIIIKNLTILIKQNKNLMNI